MERASREKEEKDAVGDQLSAVSSSPEPRAERPELPPPIPTDVWHRLRRFDRACDISLVRTDPHRQIIMPSNRPTELQRRTPPPPPPETPEAPKDQRSAVGDQKSAQQPATPARVWIVTLRLRASAGGHLYDIVQHIRPTLAEALTLAIAEAQAKGWAKG